MEKETLSEALVNLVRGCTRPFCTFWGLVALTMMLWNGMDIPLYFITLVGGMLAFWFGEKVVVGIRNKG